MPEFIDLLARLAAKAEEEAKADDDLHFGLPPGIYGETVDELRDIARYVGGHRFIPVREDGNLYHAAWIDKDVSVDHGYPQCRSTICGASPYLEGQRPKPGDVVTCHQCLEKLLKIDIDATMHRCAIFDVEDLSRGMDEVCSYNPGEEDDAAKYAAECYGFVVSLNGAEHWLGDEVNVYYVSSHVAERLGNFIDEVHLNPRCGGLVIKILRRIASDCERQILEHEPTFGYDQKSRDRRAMAKRAIDVVISIVEDRRIA